MASQIMYHDTVNPQQLVEGAVVMVRDRHDPYWMDIGEFVKHTPYGTYEIRKPSGKLYTWKYCEPLDLNKYFTQRFEGANTWQPCS